MSQITNIIGFLTIGLLTLNQNGVLVFGQISESLLGFDVRNPIIYQNVESGNHRSHFGWSVTLVETGYSRSGKSYWIFIGDPLGKSTDPTYSRVKEPGVVWRCSIGPSASGTTPECYITNLDPIDGTCAQNYNERRCRGIKPAFEYHNENWVGGTLASSSNRIVTCAHRWHRGEIPVGRPPKEQVPLVNGLCYWFNKDTMYPNWAQSQSTVNISLPNYGNHRLIPFFGNEPMEGQYWSGSNGLSNPDLAFAEAGFSIHLSQLTEWHNEVLIGAPGTRLFAGSVTRYRDGGFINGVLSQGSSRLNAANQNEFSRFSTVRLPETYTDYFNAYFGYAVTSGQYFNKGETWYVGGSPRAQRLQGQIVLFQFPQGSSNRIVDFAERATPYPSINPQFGAYFGSVLASANVNGDILGLDELFVGAPFQNTDNSGQSDGNQGAVFVFYKLSNTNNFAAITLTGSNYAGSRFGSAIASIGDINEDGFNDIAIGAPFEGPDSGGAVYIFYGKDNIINDWKFGLRISSTDFPDPIYLRGFGCSFSNAIDIDNNGTPDLAIGSFLSKSVAIFRTRPMLKITAYLKFFDHKTHKSIFRVESNVQTFNVEVCVRLSGNNTLEKPGLEVENTVKMDERYKRFKFTTAQGPNHQLIYKSSIPPGSEYCTRFEAKIASQDREIGDIANIPPIAFEQFVEYKGAPVKVSPIRVYKVAGNGLVNSAQTGPDQFCPSCPFPTSRSNSQELPITSDCKDITRCKPELTIKAWFEDLDIHKNISKVELDWHRKLTLWIYVKNTGEPAFSPEVSVNFNSQLQQPPDFLFGSSECKFEVGLRDKFNCSLGKLIRKNQEQVIGIPFTLKNIFADKADATYYVHLNAGSKTDDPKSRIVFDLTLQVIFDSRVTLIGSVTSPKDEVQIGSLFHQDYRVLLQGHSPVVLLTFNFKFPVTSDYTPGTELLIGEPQGKVYCRSGPFTDFSKLDPGHDSSIPEPNPDHDGMSVSQSRRRRRRQIEENPELAQPERIVPNENMTIWTCAESGVNCVDVHCELRNFKPGEEVISFQMKLNHITSKDEPKGKSLLLLESSGDVHLFGEGSGSQKHDSANGFSQTLIRLEIALTAGRTAIWIYIVSGIGGILLLALIMICLYKAGFFKRATKQQLEELKAQTEIQQSIQAASRRASEMGPGEQETALN